VAALGERVAAGPYVQIEANFDVAHLVEQHAPDTRRIGEGGGQHDGRHPDRGDETRFGMSARDEAGGRALPLHPRL